MKEWKTYKLEDLLSIPVRNGLTKPSSIRGKGVKMIGMGELFANEIIRDIEMPRVPTTDSELKLSAIEKGDLLFARQSLTLEGAGKCSLVKEVTEPTVFESHIIRCRVNKNLVTPEYLYYYFRSRFGRYKIECIVEQVAAAGIRGKDLIKIEIPVPDIQTQRGIVDCLSTLDEKIHYNSLINDNLDQQLQCLYREWFIENPKADWPTVSLSEIATFISGYSYKGNELVENSNTAMATIKNFERNGGFKVDGYKPIVPSSKLKVEQQAELFDILVAHTDLTQNAEVIGNAEILLSKDRYKDLIFSMDLVKVNAKESFPFQFLLALLLKNPRFKSHSIGYVNGTTVLHMNKRALPDYETIIPNSEDAQSLNATAKAIFCHMSENLTEISNLTKMRDTLLPKLMSGDLKINEIDC